MASSLDGNVTLFFSEILETDEQLGLWNFKVFEFPMYDPGCASLEEESLLVELTVFESNQSYG